MITSTVSEVRAAYRAFRRMGDELRLPQKAAWRVSRLLNKLKGVVVDFEETQLKLFLNAGATQSAGGLQLEALERGKSASDEAWNARLKERREITNKLNEDLMALNQEPVQIDYDAIPLSLFKGNGAQDLMVAPVDFADAGSFIVDDEEKK